MPLMMLTQPISVLGYDISGILLAAVNILIILTVLLIAVRLVNKAFKKLRLTMSEKNPGADQSFIGFFRYIVLAVLYIGCISGIAAQIPILESMMTTLLAGSGIAALVIGVASQNAVGNIVSGALIILFKPFRVGDTIRYITGDITGQVEEIGLRHTVIRTTDDRRVIIPNGTVNSNIIENATYGDMRDSFFLEISVTPDSDTEKAMALITQAVRSRPVFLDGRSDRQKSDGEPDVAVTVSAVSKTALTLRCRIWTEGLASANVMKSDLLLEIKRLFEENGVSLG